MILLTTNVLRHLTGFLNVLRVLTTVGDITPEAFNARFDFMASRNDTYYVLVVCDGSGEVVGTGQVMVERKFIHDLGGWIQTAYNVDVN